MKFDTYSKFTESLTNKLNIMYVHGYNSDLNSSTSSKLKIQIVDEYYYIRDIGGKPMTKMIYVSNMKIK